MGNEVRQHIEALAQIAASIVPYIDDQSCNLLVLECVKRPGKLDSHTRAERGHGNVANLVPDDATLDNRELDLAPHDRVVHKCSGAFDLQSDGGTCLALDTSRDDIEAQFPSCRAVYAVDEVSRFESSFFCRRTGKDPHDLDGVSFLARRNDDADAYVVAGQLFAKSAASAGVNSSVYGSPSPATCPLRSLLASTF